MIDPGGEAPMTRVLLFAMAFLFAAQGAEAQSSRFYLRGDLGLVLGTPAVETDTDPGSAIASLGPTTINGNYGTGMMFDAGVGFRAFPFLRLEGTIGYLPSLAFKGNFGNNPSGDHPGYGERPGRSRDRQRRHHRASPAVCRAECSPSCWAAWASPPSPTARRTTTPTASPSTARSAARPRPISPGRSAAASASRSPTG